MTAFALAEMTLEELEQLKQEVAKEIASRRANSYVTFSHPCRTSSNYHRHTYKHWVKLVKTVDVTKNSGYAFDGEFLDIEREHKVPVGSIIVTVCDDWATLWQATEDSVQEIYNCTKKAMSKLIDKAASLVQ